ncbi:unnamed protein product [Closterium sp. Yama58-4]|nr:unnamed protein product [Closterium sp. Yama58-4]
MDHPDRPSCSGTETMLSLVLELIPFILRSPGFTNLTSLTALSVGIPDREDMNLASLAHLPAVSTLVLFDNTCPNLESGEASNPFSFAQMPSLKALEFETWCPRFELLFPSGNSFTRLERLLIKGCDSLERFPDDIGQRLPGLRELSLCGCEKLLELPENFGNLHALKTLTLNLLPLSSLPDSFTQLTSLETLCLSHCYEILELPARFGFLTALNSLSILDSDLRLPDDIGSLTNLHTFRLSRHFSQQLLPSSFTQLSTLTSLHLTQCRILAKLSEDVGKLSNLRVLTIQCCPVLKKLPESLTDLINLEVLKVVGCESLTAIPSSLSNFSRLKILALAKLPYLEEVSGSLPCSLKLLSLGSFERLTSLLDTPALPNLRELSSTSEGLMGGLAAGLTLPSLEHLQLEFVGNTKEFSLSRDSLPKLRHLTVERAAWMKKFPKGLGSALTGLRWLEIRRAKELTELPESFMELQSLTFVEIHAPKLSSLPEGIGALSRLRQLNLEECSSLALLPASLTQLSCLHELNLSCTAIRSLPCHFGQLSRLKQLNLDGCEQLAALPEDFTQLKMLHSLSVKGCGKVH